MTPHVSITLLRTQTDERLIELIAAGHDRAFDAVVDRYRRPLLRYARRFLPEEARAEDVVQAAFVSAWGALRDGAPVRDLRPWLYRIVHNGALNVMKKPGGDDAPLIEASDLRPGPATEVEQREDVAPGARHDRRACPTASARRCSPSPSTGARTPTSVRSSGINDTAVRQLVSRARASLRVAATAVTPWPVAVWLAGIGGAQAADTATRVGEIVGGVGAGTLFGGGALKAGAVVAAAGAVAVGVPQVSQVVRERASPGRRAGGRARVDRHAGPARRAGAATAFVSAPATRRRRSPTSAPRRRRRARPPPDPARRASSGGRLRRPRRPRPRGRDPGRPRRPAGGRQRTATRTASTTTAAGTATGCATTTATATRRAP